MAFNINPWFTRKHWHWPAFRRYSNIVGYFNPNLNITRNITVNRDFSYFIK